MRERTPVVRMEPLPALRYDGSVEHNGLLMEWYCELRVSGDLPLVLMSSVHGWEGFLSYFQRTAPLWVAVEQGRIVRAVWFEPVMSGAYMSVWLDCQHRRTRDSAQWLRHMAQAVLQRVRVLLAITKQEPLVPLFEHFGFRLLGRVPRIWEGEDVWAFTLTAEDLNRSERKAIP